MHACCYDSIIAGAEMGFLEPVCTGLDLRLRQGGLCTRWLTDSEECLSSVIHGKPSGMALLRMVVARV